MSNYSALTDYNLMLNYSGQRMHPGSGIQRKMQMLLDCFDTSVDIVPVPNLIIPNVKLSNKTS